MEAGLKGNDYLKKDNKKKGNLFHPNTTKLIYSLICFKI